MAPIVQESSSSSSISSKSSFSTSSSSSSVVSSTQMKVMKDESLQSRITSSDIRSLMDEATDEIRNDLVVNDIDNINVSKKSQNKNEQNDMQSKLECFNRNIFDRNLCNISSENKHSITEDEEYYHVSRKIT